MAQTEGTDNKMVANNLEPHFPWLLKSAYP